MNQIKVGSYTGTGAAINISLGWVPDYVRIVNATDGDVTAEWFAGMADASSVTIVTTAGPVLDTTNQVSDYAGADASASPGFTVGSDLSESGKTFRYVAMRNVGAGS